MQLSLLAAGLLATSLLAGAPVAWAAAGNCGSAASQGATQGGGLGPSCEGQQPTTVPGQGTVSGAQGAGTGTTPNGPGGTGGGRAGGTGGGGAGSTGSGGGGTSGGASSK